MKILRVTRNQLLILVLVSIVIIIGSLIIQFHALTILSLIADFLGVVSFLSKEESLTKEDLKAEGDRTVRQVRSSLEKQENEEKTSKEEQPPRVRRALDKLTSWNFITLSYGQFQLVNTFIPILGATRRSFMNREKLSIALLYEYPKRIGSKKLQKKLK